MRILMTMNTKIFPIRTIGGIVVIIAVDMMHRQLTLVSRGELTRTLGADHAVHFQGQDTVVE